MIEEDEAIYEIINQYIKRVIKKREAIEYLIDLGFDKKEATLILKENL